MKFRNKVLLINILLLSAALGIVGFLMIDQNFKLALENQIQNATMENNLLQSYIEYEILDVVNSNSRALLAASMITAGEKADSNMLSTETSLFVRYCNKILYASEVSKSPIPEPLLNSLTVGIKSYSIAKEGDKYYIYIASTSTLQDNTLNIISKSDISAPYELMHNQTIFYRILLTVVLGICSILIYVTSTLLTRPIEQLNMISDRFAAGDYSARAHIKSRDEIERLAEKYNHMAASVSTHIQELNDMVTKREQFVSDFTHEIKTPMTTIIGYADTIRSKELPRERQILAANYIFSEGKRLESMSFKLFDLIYLGKHDIEKHRISTEVLLQNIASITIPMLKTKQIKLILSCENATIMGDKELLISAIINLIDNARKASDPESEILLRGYKEKQHYYIEVKDYGQGMTKEEISHVCDAFYMADKSRSRKEGGAGLGLSLAAIILERHNADIQIESAPGQGSTISIQFKQENPNEKK